MADAEKKEKKLTPQEIFDGFKRMREEQRQIMGKISELEAEKNEHAIVMETLKETSEDRTGYRLLNGVLVERKVGEILPALQKNYAQLGKALDVLHSQLEKKGKELGAYRDLHNIRIQGEPTKPDKEEGSKDAGESKSSEGILVS